MRATYSTRSLMIFVTIVAIDLGLATQIAASNELSEMIQLLASTLLAMFNFGVFLVLVLRSRLVWFMKLSFFVSGQDRVARIDWINLLAFACSLSIIWIVTAVVFFPERAIEYCELAYRPFGAVWLRFDPAAESPFELPMLMCWFALALGLVWIPIIATLIVAILRIFLRIHVSTSANRNFERCKQRCSNSALTAKFDEPKLREQPSA